MIMALRPIHPLFSILSLAKYLLISESLTGDPDSGEFTFIHKKSLPTWKALNSFGAFISQWEACFLAKIEYHLINHTPL